MNTPAKEMSPAKMMALIIALVVIGPVMFLFSRALSLARGFERVQVGDSADALKAAMGAPAEEAHSGPKLQYRYSSWPVPTVYVVTLEDGKVSEKSKQ
jgi:hypothetical protein